ncbi:hypothetical protein ACQ4LE_002290 [Meloidogyne hapla]
MKINTQKVFQIILLCLLISLVVGVTNSSKRKAKKKANKQHKLKMSKKILKKEKGNEYTGSEGSKILKILLENTGQKDRFVEMKLYIQYVNENKEKFIEVIEAIKKLNPEFLELFKNEKRFDIFYKSLQSYEPNYDKPGFFTLDEHVIEYFIARDEKRKDFNRILANFDVKGFKKFLEEKADELKKLGKDENIILGKFQYKKEGFVEKSKKLKIYTKHIFKIFLYVKERCEYFNELGIYQKAIEKECESLKDIFAKLGVKTVKEENVQVEEERKIKQVLSDWMNEEEDEED